MQRINKYLFYALGLFAGMTTLVVQIGPLEANYFSVILAVTVLCGVVSYRKIFIKYDNNEKYLVYFFAFGLVANILSLTFEGSVWKNANINALVMSIFGVFGMLLVYPLQERRQCSAYFIQGFKINCLIQSIWGVIQDIACTIFHIPLNATLGLLHSRTIVSPTYQVVGLGYERAQYCVLLIIGFTVIKNKYIRLLAAVSVILSQSRTGVIMLILMILFMHSFREWMEIIIKVNIKKLVFFVCGIILLFLLKNWIVQSVTLVQNRFIRIEKDASGVKHLSYYTRFFKTLMNMNPVHTFFGYGTATSGFPYTLLYGTNDRGIAWNLESTWLANFWGYGILGFFSWMNWMIRSCCFYYKNNRKIFAIFLSVLIGGFGYQLMPNFIIVTMLSVCLALDQPAGTDG